MEIVDIIISRLKYFQNRRKYPRVLLDLPVEYRTEYSPHAHGGIVIDACEVGFLLQSTENMLVGTQLRIVVLYPEEYSLAMLEVFAKIVWKRFEIKEKRYLYGLKFNGILAEDDYKLKGLLKINAESPSPIPMRPS